MKQHIFRIFFFVAFVVVLISFTTTTEAAKKYKHGAKTPPPAQQITMNGMFSSDDQYLSNGTNLISEYSSGTVRLEGTTYANQVVGTIDIDFYLQKWSGSSWGNVGSTTTYSDSNKDVFDKTVYRSAEVGYYYRVRTIHWINENGTYENGERVSDYILMK